ncbi:YaaC family protein [Sinomonas humi]|uniref:YaaC family protein n=1 Tax=Sinomonas humi TaxID=1338436 RepID=UPI0012E090DF|nr:hypothetical protein [Sinomonas humi]
MFVSALEQAEQQFEAAENVGYESRSLNLYYGLSQAGRAVSAALTPDDPKVSPEVRKHGLRVLRLDDVKADGLLETEVRGEGGSGTSFGRLAWLLDSDPLEAALPLSAAWNMILEVPRGSLLPGHPVPLSVSPAYDPAAPLLRSKHQFTIPLSPQAAVDGAASMKLLYPDLAPGLLCTTTGNGQHIDGSSGERTDLALFELEDFESQLRDYRQSTVLMPACGPGRKPLDPLLAWWVLLYALSMVTRYKPVAWTQAVDVNTSRQAVPLETVLSKASEALPDMILSLLTKPLRPLG